MRRSWCCVLSVGCLVLWGRASGAQPDEVQVILGRCAVTQTQPRLPQAVSPYETMNYFPALGNGNLMVTLSGTPDRLTFHLGKTDFWRDRCRDKKWWQSGNVLAGYLSVLMPDLAGASFQQSVDFHRAEAVTLLTKADRILSLRSIVPHESENLLVNTIENLGKQPVALRIETCADQFANRAEPFELAAGIDEKDPAIAWTTRKTHVPPDHNDFGSDEFRMWAAVVTRLFDAQCQTQIDNSINYDANDTQVKSAQLFTLEPGRSLLMVTKVHSTGLPVTMNPADPRPPTLEAVKALARPQIQGEIEKHRTWWNTYWRKSYVRLEAEPVVERTYYGCLYVLGCSTRVGQYPAGCNGFPVNDDVPWGGDYHWNYNHEALFYGVYSANRIEQSEPYDRTVLEANVFGKAQAKAAQVPGTFFFMATGPGHLNEPITLGQKTHAVEAALNLIQRYYTTYDLEWAKSVYPFFKDVAAYWDHDLEKNKETRPNGTPRYVVVDSKPMEGPTVDTYNPITALAFLQRFYRGLIDLTQDDLAAAGHATGATEQDLARWKNFLANLAEYPMSHAYGRKVFAWSEATLNPLLTEQDWVLYPVFPGEQVGLASDPRLLAVARNTLAIKPQYYVEWLNNPPQIFSIAARLAEHPPEVLERFRTYFSRSGVNGLRSGGGNTEGAGVADAINAMLLQSHEGFLRLFPCWHHPEAKFVTIRTAGAFLVSAEKKAGVCQPLTIVSEKGRPCRVLNPWPGRTIVVSLEGTPVEVAVADRSYGQVCTFATQAGKTYVVSVQGDLPAAAPYWNAALYQPASASSNFKPEKEKDNWDVAKLTDGTRINTRVGHRGWTSALYDDAKHTEWAQVDLQQAVSAKAIQLWPLDHGDAWQNTHCSEPFVESTEIDQSYDGFPLDFRILVSPDGKAWAEVAKRDRYRRPAVGPDDSERKAKDVTGPERFDFEPCTFRYVKVEATRLRKTRYFGKYALQLAEIEVVRADPVPPKPQP